MTNAKAIEILREKINEEFSTDTAEAGGRMVAETQRMLTVGTDTILSMRAVIPAEME